MNKLQTRQATQQVRSQFANWRILTLQKQLLKTKSEQTPQYSTDSKLTALKYLLKKKEVLRRQTLRLALKQLHLRTHIAS